MHVKDGIILTFEINAWNEQHHIIHTYIWVLITVIYKSRIIGWILMELHMYIVKEQNKKSCLNK